MRTDFMLDVLEQALYDRRLELTDALFHHSDSGLAETINGQYKAELTHHRAPWNTKESLALAMLEWVSCFNHHRPLESI